MTAHETTARPAAPAAPDFAGSLSHRSLAVGSILAGALVATLLAALLRLALLTAPPQFDELYHVLAARSVLQSGTYAVGEGIYDRAFLYTRLVALAFDAFGESLAAGRIPALVAGSLLAGVVYAFVHLVAGRLAAAVAAFFTIVWPEGIAVSELVRFYALHGLAFLLGAMALYALVERPAGLFVKAVLAVVAVALLALAAHLQPTTFIGLAGLAVWLGLFVVLPFVWSLRWRWLALAALALGGGAALAVAVAAGWLAKAWAVFRWTPLWLAEWQDYQLYYHDVLLDQYPLLWPLTPLAIIIALAVRPRPVIMATTVFGVGLALHSIGGMKSFRYLYYLMPFLFLVWGVAIAAVASAAAGALARVGRESVMHVLPVRVPAGTGAALAACAVLFALVANPAFPLAARMALSPEPPQTLADMAAARPALAEAVSDADLVLVGSELHALYYLGRADVLVSASRQSELAAGEEFAVDPRTGLPVVAQAASVEALVACTATGVFVTPAPLWEKPETLLRGAVEPLIGSPLRRIDLPETSHVVAYRWSHEPETGVRCEDLPRVARR